MIESGVKAIEAVMTASVALGAVNEGAAIALMGSMGSLFSALQANVDPAGNQVFIKPISGTTGADCAGRAQEAMDSLTLLLSSALEVGEAPIRLATPLVSALVYNADGCDLEGATVKATPFAGAESNTLPAQLQLPPQLQQACGSQSEAVTVSLDPHACWS